MRIILGMTGSVASVLHKKLVTELQTIGDVDVVLTKSAMPFISMPELCDALEQKSGNALWDDEDEWKWKRKSSVENNENHVWSSKKWKKGDQVVHIELRDKAGVLVIAPCSANTLAKLANGLTDNLLTSVARAWDMTRLNVIAPAMNTHMWKHPVTQEHIEKLQNWGWIVVPPQEKMLACKTMGMGAMADISLIVAVIKEQLRWTFPIWDDVCKGIPVGAHQGAFNAQRKYSIHTGVDMYVPVGTKVHAVEDGRIVCVEKFTGPSDKSPWWLDTDCMLVEGSSGVICYGEIQPFPWRTVGQTVKAGDALGTVLAVLPESKFRPDIDGHMVSMLHMELYPHGRYIPSDGYEKDKGDLRDATPHLMEAWNAPTKTFVHPKPETA